ncbi:MAG: 2-amino-4-hydroxy-6-hydroxymethyldihydropteridine diphosphokinase [Bacteroides sp.]|nr:2-amino-4-hydroxy-6-hydroxymethyldihydropteridine diphosphokinase [Bacteroides sp.]
MHKVYLGLGTNQGDKEANLRAAVEEIEKRVGEITSLSAFYDTEPWGFASDNRFLNAVCCVSTGLEPFELLAVTQNIERMLGRRTKSVNGFYSDRPIDIDILLYDDLRLYTPTLTIPHPLMTERDFVMKPLEEIAPEVIRTLGADKKG